MFNVLALRHSRRRTRGIRGENVPDRFSFTYIHARTRTHTYTPCKRLPGWHGIGKVGGVRPVLQLQLHGVAVRALQPSVFVLEPVPKLSHRFADHGQTGPAVDQVADERAEVATERSRIP